MIYLVFNSEATEYTHAKQYYHSNEQQLLLKSCVRVFWVLYFAGVKIVSRKNCVSFQKCVRFQKCDFWHGFHTVWETERSPMQGLHDLIRFFWVYCQARTGVTTVRNIAFMISTLNSWTTYNNELIEYLYFIYYCSINFNRDWYWPKTFGDDFWLKTR